MKQFLQLIRPFREMRKIVVLCLAMVMSLGVVWGQTTHTIGWGTASGDAGTYTNFTAISGSVTGVCSFEAVKNSSASNPAYNANASELRLYYNSGGNGGSIIITPISGISITGAVMTTSTSPSVAYYVDGGDAVSVSASNNTYTISGISATTSLEIKNVNTSNTQLRIKTIALTYTVSGTQPTTYTVAFDAGDGTFVGNSDFPNASNSKVAGTYTLPSATRDGYTFDGWLATGSSTPIAGSYTVSDDVAFTAQYTESTSGGAVTATLTQSNLELTGSYTTNTSKTIDGITYVYTDLMKSNTNIQAKASTGTIMNTTAYPGDIISVAITHSGTARATTINGSADGTNWTQVATGNGSITADFSNKGYKYFQITRGTNAAYWTKIEITYATGGSSLDQSDLDITNTSTDLSFDLYNNSAAQTISYTTSSTGAITITPASPTSYFSYVHDAAAKTITITPLAVTPGAQTITISQEADDDYYAGTATFTVSVINSDPNAPGTINNPYTVAQARAAIDANTGTQGVYAAGIVSEIVTAYNTQYGNISFNFIDEGNTTDVLEAYRCASGTGVDASEVAVGDTVVVYGDLIKYGSTYEFGQGCQLVSLIHPLTDVEAPTFSPVAGTYAEAQDVTISCATTGANIYYTLDGTEPTSESTAYTSAITVSSTTTIKAIAYVGNEASTVATAIYHICSADNPYTVTQALNFTEYPANGIYVTGIVSTAPTSLNNGTLTYYISDDGEAEDQLEIYKGKNLENGDFTAVGNIQVGDIVTIYGNVVIYGTSNPIKEFAQGNYLVSFVRPAVPSITVAPATVDATSEGAEGSLTITYENIPDLISFDIQFCDANGDELAGDDPDWIYAGIEGDEGDYTIDYIINANEAAARTAYFKVYTSVGGNNVYSNLVIINQAKFQLDYATLPFEWEGGSSAAFLELDGVTTNGLGSDYASNNSPYLIKLDSNGDYIQVKCDQRPGKVTIGVKMIGGANTSTITVQGSADGETFTDVEELEVSGSQNDTLTLETTNAFANTDRYVRLLFTKGSNVGVGPISIALPVANPSVTVAPDLVETPAEGANGTFTVTYEDMGDSYEPDVEFFEEDGVTPATYDWIHVNVNAENNVEYVIDANTGVARTAYMKVVGLYGNDEGVYSNLVTITQAAPVAVTVTITGNTSTADYDGEEHSVSGYTVTAIEIDGVATDLYTEDDFTFNGTDSASRTEFGTTYMGLTDEQFTNTNANFSVTFNVTDGYLTIEKASMTVAVMGHTDTVTYNGSEQSVSGYSLSCESALYDETLVSYSDTAEAKGTAVGTYPMGLEAEQFSYGNSNINVAFNIVNDGGLEITANTTAITVIPGSGSRVYDGTPFTMTEHDDFTVTGVPESFSWTATADGTVTNVIPGAGEKAVNAVTSFHIFDADGNDVTAYFTNITYQSGNLAITPKSVVITVNDATKTYGETDPDFTGTVVGLDNPDALASFSYIRTNADVEDVGTYENVLSASYVPNNNYHVAIDSGNFTISCRDLLNKIDSVYWPDNITDRNECYSPSNTEVLPSADSIKNLILANNDTLQSADFLVTTKDSTISANNNGWEWARTYAISISNPNYCDQASRVIYVSGSDQSAPERSSAWPTIDSVDACLNNVDLDNIIPDSQTLFEDCSGLASVTYTQDTTGNIGWTIRRMFVATDSCANTRLDTLIVSGRDMTPPVAAQATNDTLWGAYAQCLCDSIQVIQDFENLKTLFGISDACSGEDVSLVSSSKTLKTGEHCAYTVIIAYVVADAIGNQTTIYHAQFIQDTTKPTFDIVPHDTTLCVDPDGNYENTVTRVADEITITNLHDNCTKLQESFSVQSSMDTSRFDFYHPRGYRITQGDSDNGVRHYKQLWTVTDSCGNTTYDSISIHVRPLPKITRIINREQTVIYGEAITEVWIYHQYSDLSITGLDGIGLDSLGCSVEHKKDQNNNEYDRVYGDPEFAVSNATFLVTATSHQGWGCSIDESTFSITVQLRPIVITATDATKKYDGTPLTSTDYTCTTDEGSLDDALVHEDVISRLSFSGSQTNVGSCDNTPDGAKITAPNDTTIDKTSNYWIDYYPGTLTVTANDTAITVKAGSGSRVYDGTPFTMTEHDDFTVTGVPEALTWTATADGTVTNVVPGEGEKAVNAVTSFQIFDADGHDVTSYFTNIIYQSGTLAITPKSVVITVNDATKTYGESDPELTATVNGLEDGDTISYSLSREEGENVGQYVISVVGDTLQGYYQVSYQPGILTITPVQDEVVVTVVGNSQSNVYDGQAHIIMGYEITNISNELYTMDDFAMPAQDAAVATATRTYVGTTTMELSADDFANISANFDSVRFDVTPGYQNITIVCEKIVLDAENTEWVEDFEDITDTTTLWTGVTPYCWTVAEQYTNASLNEIGEQIDTMPQVYRGFNTTPNGHYSLRMHFKSLLAMPELDESVDLGKIRLSMYVRQSFWRYQLQIGVLTNDGTFHPVAVVNNPDKTKTYFECGFEAVKDLLGEGRRIAFKNFGSNENDPYAVNYMDDITLTYVNEENCLLSPDTTITFEGLTTLSGATGVEPTCWEVITPDVELTSTTKPQLYRGFNSTEGGHYSLRMMNRCVYAMPEFDEEYPIENLTMTLKLRQPNSLYRLQVGVVDEQGTFHLVKTLKSGTTMEAKTVSFANYSGSGRIAFRNTLVPGTGMRTDYLDYSYNYIDDINITLTDGAKIDADDENILDFDLEEIAVYPNPTTGNLYIDAIGIQKVECYNQMGQLVRVYDNVRNSIDLNNLSEGVYTLRITVPQGVTMRKVVKK